MLDLSLISLAQFYSSTPNETEEAKCGHLVRIIDWEHNSDDNAQCKTLNKSTKYSNKISVQKLHY